MKSKASKEIFDHSGSSFDRFLDEEGIRGEVEAVAVKRILAWQLENAMRKQQKTKQSMARELHTSRSQLDRLLDPQNVSISLDTITRAAKALGKRVIVRITDASVQRRSALLQRGPARSAPRERSSIGTKLCGVPCCLAFLYWLIPEMRKTLRAARTGSGPCCCRRTHAHTYGGVARDHTAARQRIRSRDAK